MANCSLLYNNIKCLKSLILERKKIVIAKSYSKPQIKSGSTSKIRVFTSAQTIIVSIGTIDVGTISGETLIERCDILGGGGYNEWAGFVDQSDPDLLLTGLKLTAVVHSAAASSCTPTIYHQATSGSTIDLGDQYSAYIILIQCSRKLTREGVWYWGGGRGEGGGGGKGEKGKYSCPLKETMARTSL